MSNKNVRLLFRGQITLLESKAIRDELVWTNIKRHVAPTVTCNVATFRGVDGGDIDIWIDDTIATEAGSTEPYALEENLVLEAWHKLGSFDGTPRLSLTLRQMQRGQRAKLPETGLKITRCKGWLSIIFSNMNHEFRDLSHTVCTAEDAKRILLFHYRSWYLFLESEDVNQFMECWADNQVGLDIVEVNREASRELYRMAREAGYRKFTKREQLKFGLNTQWHKAEAGFFNRSGCGQATLEAAAGLPVPDFSKPE